jgi:CubicO group peptidase (beta-lactamase class C family)
VAKDGAVVFAHAQRRPAQRQALTPTHRFRVASHSKTFTTAGILRLVDAGRLRLDDRAGTYVAGLDPRSPRATVSQLLSHTGGIIRDGEDSEQWLNPGRPFLNEGELRAALAEPPTLPPNSTDEIHQPRLRPARPDHRSRHR